MDLVFSTSLADLPHVARGMCVDDYLNWLLVEISHSI